MPDGQWNLNYLGVESYDFGRPEDGVYLAAAPDLGSPEFIADDAQVPRGDGRRFGQDYLGGRTITFELAVAEDTARDALDLVSRAGKAWRADALRAAPGAVAGLTTTTDGAYRAVFGRPRRFAADLENVHQGVAEVIAEFACVDDLFHGEQQATTIGLVPPPTGGLTTPFITPLVTALEGASPPGAIRVGGDANVFPVFTVHGPITNPVIDLGVWKIALLTTLTASESVVVDPRPWVRTIRTNSGRSLAGALTRGSRRLSQAFLAPGSYEAVLTGTDPTGTSYLNVAWRDAYTTL